MDEQRLKIDAAGRVTLEVRAVFRKYSHADRWIGLTSAEVTGRLNGASCGLMNDIVVDQDGQWRDSRGTRVGRSAGLDATITVEPFGVGARAADDASLERKHEAVRSGSVRHFLVQQTSDDDSPSWHFEPQYSLTTHVGSERMLDYTALLRIPLRVHAASATMVMTSGLRRHRVVMTGSENRVQPQRHWAARAVLGQRDLLGHLQFSTDAKLSIRLDTDAQRP